MFRFQYNLFLLLLVIVFLLRMNCQVLYLNNGRILYQTAWQSLDCCLPPSRSEKLMRAWLFARSCVGSAILLLMLTAAR